MKKIFKKLFYLKSLQPFYWFFKNILENFYYSSYKHFFYKLIPVGKRRVFLQWKSISKTKNKSKKINALNILMVPFNGFSDTVLAFESAVGKSLELRGHSVNILSCNSSLPACQWNFDGNGTPKFELSKLNKFKVNILDQCKKCNNNIKEVCKNSEINLKSINDYVDKGVNQRALDFIDKNYNSFDDKILYKGINISEHAYSTTIRVLLRGSLDEQDPFSIELYKRYLISAYILIDNLENFFKKNKVDRIVAVHGIYLEHGILCDFAVKNNIPVIIWGTPYRKNCIYAAHNDTYHRELINEDNSAWESIILDDKMNSKLENYLGSKLSGGRDNVNYHPNPIIDKKKLIEEINLDPKKPIVSLFTNVLWDAQIFYESNAFDNMLDWINYTIEKFSNLKNLQLVIRIHPAESKAGLTTNQPLEKEILSRFEKIPSNVTIVPPESNISSYTLADISVSSLVYGTNMALEIAIRGIPLIIVGECCSRGKGFSYDIKTKAEYDQILNRVSDLKKPTQDQILIAKKYAYHLFFRRMIDFNVYDTPISGKTISRQAKFNFNSEDQLLDSSLEGLDIFCNGIINLEKFVKL